MVSFTEKSKELLQSIERPVVSDAWGFATAAAVSFQENARDPGADFRG